MTFNPDYSTLPAPIVIEELDSTVIESRQIAKFKEIWATVRIANPDMPAYDVELLETDPARISIQAETFRETLVRGRINDAMQAYMLPFARGADLDMLAWWYGVSRMAGELDERLRRRVVLAIQGRSTGGTAARYRSIAMEADLRVEDCVVYTVGRSPVVHVAVFSTETDGVASPGLLAIVDSALHRDDVIMVSDTIEVASAVRNVVDVTADVWLLPDADAATLARMETALRSAWLSAQALGRDFTCAWWVSKLMIDGVHKVTPVAPLIDVENPFNHASAIGTVTLNLKGRSY